MGDFPLLFHTMLLTTSKCFDLNSVTRKSVLQILINPALLVLITKHAHKAQYDYPTCPKKGMVYTTLA